MGGIGGRVESDLQDVEPLREFLDVVANDVVIRDIADALGLDPAAPSLAVRRQRRAIDDREQVQPGAPEKRGLKARGEARGRVAHPSFVCLGGGFQMLSPKLSGSLKFRRASKNPHPSQRKARMGHPSDCDSNQCLSQTFVIVSG